MVLSNDKKRREFIENPANWEQVGMLNNLIRLMKLTYKEHEWFAIDIWQSGTTFDFQKRKTGVPGVRKRLKITVMRRRKRIPFMPFRINRSGTFESPTQTARNAPAMMYPVKLFIRNREIMYPKVAITFTRGSSL